MPPHAGLDRRTRALLVAGMILLLGFSGWRLFFAAPPGPYVALSGRSMGTTWDVKVASRGLRGDAVRGLAATIQARLDHVESLMSTYDPDSELMRFNRQASTEPFPASPETLAVFAAAREVSRLSSGAFDVTVKPLVEAWGFGAASRDDDPPSDAEIQSLRERVGWDRIAVDPPAGTLRKTRADVEADLSAIAKGFGVDEVADALAGLGYENYLVEVGGELRARGRRLDGLHWRVAIERPDATTRAIQEVIELRDQAMATSGDYRNYYERDGVRLSHTIDPRDGHPIRHRLASVTVLHATAMQADGLATALDVLGPDEGYTLAVREGLAAYLLVRGEDGGFEVRATPAFSALLTEDADDE